MLLALYYVVLIADIVLLLGLALSILVPEHRIWPPPRKNSWQYRASWFFIVLASVGAPIVGILDWESLGPIYWIRIPIGIAVIVFAAILSLWAIRTLSMHQSLGLTGNLVSDGPYRHSRNPQYVALILFYLSFILITASYMELVSGALLSIMYALTPLSEEPWLKEQFGQEYEDYCRRVPRFIGLTIKRSR